MSPERSVPDSHAKLDVLSSTGLTAGYDGRAVVQHLDLEFLPGSSTALLGPNGSGKSTVLRAVARLLKPTAGIAAIDGRDIARLPTREVARRLAVLPQAPVPPGGVTVRELVEQGRHPHRGVLQRATADDVAAIDEALELTGMDLYRDREVDTLSGGERQRAWIALALAQRTGLLLLDEPTTYLDIGHQLEVLQLVDRLRTERRLTVLMVLHDLNHAARFADRVVVLQHGRVVADGAPVDVVTVALCRDVFGVHASILTDPVTGAPVCLPHDTVAPGHKSSRGER